MTIQPHTIDHIEIIAFFHAMLAGNSAERVVRVLGDPKLGKSHLLTKVLPALARHVGASCAVSDLRTPSQGPIDHLLLLRQELHGLAFKQFDAEYREWTNRPQINASGLTAILALVSLRSHDDRNEERLVGLLTRAFVEDLRHNAAQMVVLVFDSVEQAQSSTQSWLMDNLLVQVSGLAHLRVAVGGRTLPDAAGSYAPCCHSYELRPVAEMTPYVEYCRAVHARLPEDHIPSLVRAFRYAPGAFVEAVTSAFMA